MRFHTYLILAMLVCTFTSSASSDMDRNNTQQLLRRPYKSVVDNLERDYFLYLPNGYEEDSAKQWPVLVFCMEVVSVGTEKRIWTIY